MTGTKLATSWYIGDRDHTNVFLGQRWHVTPPWNSWHIHTILERRIECHDPSKDVYFVVQDQVLIHDRLLT